MGMANACEQQGKSKAAVEWYTAASEDSESPVLHGQLVAAFAKLGRPDLAKKEQEWMASFDKQQREREAQMEAERKAERDRQQQANPSAAPQAAPGQAPNPTPGPAGIPAPKPAGRPG